MWLVLVDICLPYGLVQKSIKYLANIFYISFMLNCYIVLKYIKSIVKSKFTFFENYF